VKLLLFAVLGVLAVLLVLALSPLALIYFLFDRLCECVEEFKPRTRGRSSANGKGGQRLDMLKKVLAVLSKNAPTSNHAGGHSPDNPALQ
jgi:hypothetical protein